jgi:7-carboxy-7-deazaguanine synthase
MIFIRFWGCPLACPWCDEPLHKDPKARRNLTLDSLLEQIESIGADIPSVLLTGGEPLAVEQLPLLIAELKKRGKWLSMESSGVGYDIPDGLDWLTISPKKAIAEERMVQANELKFIVGPNPSATQLQEINHWAAIHPNVWLQPRADNNQPNLQANVKCLELVLASQGRLNLSAQLHKYLKIP